MDELAQAEQLAAEVQAVPMGRLRLNAPVSFGMNTLAPRLPDYMKAHPKVELELTLTLSNRAVDMVEEGYDAVFRVGTLQDSGLIARALAPSYLKKRPRSKTPWDL